MRHGAVPFRDLFSSQGPLHLMLIWLGDLPRTSWSPRVASFVAGVVLTMFVYFIGRRITSRTAAVLGAVLVTTSGSILWTTGPATADGPTIAFIAAGVLLALRYDETPGTGAAIATGLASGAAMLVKTAVGALGALPAIWILWRRRRRRDLLAAAIAAMLLALAVAAPFGLRAVLDQSVRYQLHSHREQSVVANLHKIVRTLLDRDLAVVVVLAVAVAGSILVARREPDRHIETDGTLTMLLIWALPTFAFSRSNPRCGATTSRHSSPRSHSSLSLDELRSSGSSSPRSSSPRSRSLACTMSSDRRRTRRTNAPRLAAMRRLPAGGKVISDEIGLVWQAGRTAPADVSDTSIKQIQQGRLTTGRVASAAVRSRRLRRPRVAPSESRLASRPRGTGSPASVTPWRNDSRRGALVCCTRIAAPEESVSLGSASATDSVESSQDADARDHRAERHEFRGDVEKRDPTASTATRVEKDVPSTTASPSTAPIGFTPASPSMSFSPRSSRNNPREAPMTTATAIPVVEEPSSDQEGDVGHERDLQRSARCPIEQIREVRAQRDEHRVDDQAASRPEPRRCDQQYRDCAPARQLHESGRQRSRAGRADVATKASRAVVTEHVVEQPEESERDDREQDEAPRRRRARSGRRLPKRRAPTGPPRPRRPRAR